MERTGAVQVRLDTLPREIFLHICTFLSAKFVIETLSQVCVAFSEIIGDDITWKVRLTKLYESPYVYKTGIKAIDDEFNWKAACIEVEEERRLWLDENMTHFNLEMAHETPAHALCFLKKSHLCASGSNDQILKIWDFSLLDINSKNLVEDTLLTSAKDQHQGWIWTITQVNEKQICTGGFNSYVKLWDISSELQVTAQYKGKSPVLCVALIKGTIAVGAKNNQFVLLDPRNGLSVISQHNFRKNGILCMAVKDDYLITGNEDGPLVIFDVRNSKKVKSIELSDYAVCMSHNYNKLWIGDVRGGITLIDTIQGRFEVEKTYSAVHNDVIMGIRHNLGCTISCSKDRTIRISGPRMELPPLTNLSLRSEIISIDYKKNVMTASTGQGSLHIWRPA